MASSREESPSATSNIDGEGSSSAIILSTEEILSMTMNSTRSLSRATTARGAMPPTAQAQIEDITQRDDVEQQHSSSNTDTGLESGEAAPGSPAPAAPSGNGRVVTLSNDEVLDITGRSSVLSTTSTRDSNASLSTW